MDRKSLVAVGVFTFLGGIFFGVAIGLFSARVAASSDVDEVAARDERDQSSSAPQAEGSVREPPEPGPQPERDETPSPTREQAAVATGAPTPPPGAGLAPIPAGLSREEVAQLTRRVEDLERAHAELFGEAVPRDESAGPPPARMGSTPLAAAFRAALAEEHIAGDVEGVDCSEHPCIVFGRLRGDEEDVEELERSEALAPYRDDVLNLLLWAVTTSRAGEDRDNASDEDEAVDEGEESPETALFALAFYSREELGQRDALERRIRARVVEVWNTDRPGWETRDATAP